ncbi:hypothetical protein OH77DRAFT_1432333 [Trametes cingulata]|nr:hypothetical protein OH77DRAFT_1432333 [Trametes cingulata]
MRDAAYRGVLAATVKYRLCTLSGRPTPQGCCLAQRSPDRCARAVDLVMSERLLEVETIAPHRKGERMYNPYVKPIIAVGSTSIRTEYLA